MKVFLTGATGYVGGVVAEKLMTSGHVVTGLAHNEVGVSKLEQRGITPVMGDLNKPDTLAGPAIEADGVIHCGFIHDFSNYAGMIVTECNVLSAFSDALSNSGKPFVSTQATGYIQDTGTALVDETFPIVRGTPFAARAEAEARALQVAERGIRASVLRLPMCVYGRGGSYFVPMLLRTARENGASYWIEPGTSLQSTVHVEDLADLYVLALQSATAGSLYNAALESNIASRDLAQAVADNTGLPLKSVAADQANNVLGPVLTVVLSVNNNVSGAKAERELGWRKRTTVTFLDDIARGSYRV